MQKTLPDKNTFLFIGCIVALLLFATAIADENPATAYRNARAEMIAAYQAEDYATMRAVGAQSLDVRPGYPGALFNLALAEYAVAVAVLYEPIGEAHVVASYSKADFIPEGIAAGADGKVYLGSIRHGEIVKIGVEPRLIAAAADGPHWSVFGMRLAADGKLWFVSSAIAEFAELDTADEGRNGLYAIDTDSGEIVVRAALPATENEQVLGDLILVDADTVFLADQLDGVIYRYSISSGEFSTVLERGALASPQGFVLDESGENIYVADYIGGLFRVEIETGIAKRVTPLESASDYGIDGLYRYGNKLIAIQNGIRPNRVVAFTLSGDGMEIVGSRILAMNLPEFDEPNLGVIRGDEFLFISNSHWNRFDRDGNLPDDLAGPIVLSISLLETSR